MAWEGGTPYLHGWSSALGKARGEGNKKLSVIKRVETGVGGVCERKEDPLECFGKRDVLHVG